MLFGMTVNTDQTGQRNLSDRESDPASRLTDTVRTFTQGGAMDMLGRVGDQMQQNFDRMYSSANMNRMLDQVMDALPPEFAEKLREGLKQLFNAVSGASDDEPDIQRSLEYQTMNEIYGAGGGGLPSV